MFPVVMKIRDVSREVSRHGKSKEVRVEPGGCLVAVLQLGSGEMRWVTRSGSLYAALQKKKQPQV